MQARNHLEQILRQALLTLVFSTGLLRGQTDSTDADNSIAEGVWALQFSISNNFTLTPFKGTMLSAKYHLSTTNAIRFGVYAKRCLITLKPG